MMFLLWHEPFLHLNVFASRGHFFSVLKISHLIKCNDTNWKTLIWIMPMNLFQIFPYCCWWLFVYIDFLSQFPFVYLISDWIWWYWIILFVCLLLSKAFASNLFLYTFLKFFLEPKIFSLMESLQINKSDWNLIAWCHSSLKFASLFRVDLYVLYPIKFC